jgi:hypothetical protein
MPSKVRKANSNNNNKPGWWHNTVEHPRGGIENGKHLNSDHLTFFFKLLAMNFGFV